MKKVPVRSVLLIAGIATCLLLLTTTQRALIGITQGPLPRTRLQFFVADAAHYYLWAIAAFPIYWITLRLALRKTKSAVLFLAHLCLAFAFGLVNIALQAAAVGIVFEESILQTIQSFFYVKLAMRVAFYYLILVACSVLIEYQRRREEEVKARNLETKLALAQFQVLKSKLSPQFLSETLRSISHLMQRNIEEADRLTARLGDFLRLALESTCASYVALQDELDLVRTYVDIRRFDYPDLEMSLQLDPNLISIPVPSRILLDVVQSAAPENPFEMICHTEGEYLEFAFVNLPPPAVRHASSTLEGPANAPAEPSWQLRDQKLVTRIPFVSSAGMESAWSETFFTSLDEFHRSLAQKEKIMRSSRPSSHRRFWATLGVWTLAGLFFFSTEMMSRLSNGQPLMVYETLKDSLAWYWWALYTPVIFLLARKFPLKAGILKRNIGFHMMFSAVVSFNMALLYLGQRWLLDQEVTSNMLTGILVGYPYVFDALTYWAILGVHEGLLQRWQYLQEDVRTDRLRGNLMEAQVQALKMQLHPHFLFNALNSISELMHEDRPAAEEMLKRLGAFLQLTFQSSDVQEITLRNELNFLRNYLDIQQVRFQNRLKVELKIEPGALQDRVPNLILQPIVENAIQHGVSPRIDSGKVEIRAFHRSGNLCLQVEDDGPGMPSGGFREGIGMSNTRMRLKQIYGADCRFGVQNNPQGGLVVTLEIPATGMKQHDGPH